MRTLKLTVKRKWFDKILSGEKIEEYREIKPYWVNRLMTWYYEESERFENIEALEKLNEQLKETNEEGYNFYKSGFKFFGAVEFKNGYQKNAPTILIQCNEIRIGLPEQAGAEEFERESGIPRQVFIIDLGKIISKKNIQ